jgi:hypothetical protein
VFAWGAALRRDRPPSWLRFIVFPVPAILFAVGLIALVNHFGERAPSDPPYMEFTLLLLAATGMTLVWKPAPLPDKTQPGKDEGQPQEDSAAKENASKCFWQPAHCSRLIALSALLTLAAFLAWWSTEVLYAQQVVYSYAGQTDSSKK